MGVFCKWAYFANGRILQMGVFCKWAYFANGRILQIIYAQS
jgi:hypothetical protein